VTHMSHITHQLAFHAGIGHTSIENASASLRGGKSRDDGYSGRGGAEICGGGDDCS
jgi:hypothetical protein